MKDLDGLATAHALIAEELAKRTGELDLSNLNLAALPEEIVKLTHLQILRIGNRSQSRSHQGENTLSVSLAPLATLTNLEFLDCAFTQVADLTPIANLTSLERLDISSTQVADLTPISKLANLRTLDCSFTPIGSITPIAAIISLTSLNCTGCQISDLTPLTGCENLEVLDCSSTPIADLTPIARLTALRDLHFSSTSVTSLHALIKLANLQRITFAETAVHDLKPISILKNLQHINCHETGVTDLTPIADLTGLQYLDAHDTAIADLTAITNLVNLQTLYCYATRVNDLAPVASLVNLRTFSCSSTTVDDLSPIASLANLVDLFFYSTRVTSLAPLSNLHNLSNLYFHSTQISDLTPIAHLAKLEALYCSGTRIQTIPDEILWHPNLTYLDLSECKIEGIPSEILASGLSDLRAHLTDQSAGTSTEQDVKLLVLGNGKAGKTQLVNRLRGQDFNPSWDSTHGIRITGAALPGTPSMPIHIWDFGGQDIYHGTHALFAHGAGIFVVVWSTDSEGLHIYNHQGINFRNHPLPYWLVQARHYAGSTSPIIIVQTKCDTKEDERQRPPADDALLAALPYGALVHFSSRTHRGEASLIETLRDAIDWHRHPERGGQFLIGLGRLEVRRRVEAIRDADAALPVEQRRNRWITAETFEAWCAEDGRISDPKAFLRYLHNVGVLFYRDGLFDDRIILDQQWALDAVYAVFNREQSYRHILAQDGRFTLRLLGDLVWRDYGEQERELLLSMMVTCGICFQHRFRESNSSIIEYIAPDLLPKRERVSAELEERWDAASGSALEQRFDFPLMHSALMRALICRIGEAANVHGLYWQGGVYAYDRVARSRALIEHIESTGQIILRTKGGAAEQLLNQLTEWIGKEASRFGLTIPESPKQAAAPPKPHEQAAPAEPDFGPSPRLQRSLFVSYAWGSNSEGATEVDKLRTEVVDRLCHEAMNTGIKVQRDKDDLRFGDRISKFMDAMIEGDRIAVILSAKYLRSAWCMTELYGIWQRSGMRGDDFLRKVRVYALPDSNFSTPLDRLRIAAHWNDQYKAMKNILDEFGLEILGSQDFRQFKLIDSFRGNIGDILATIADTVRPVREDEFHRWSFADLLPESAQQAPTP